VTPYSQAWTRAITLYFIGVVDHPFVKIGGTDDIERRLTQIQEWAPFPLKLLARVNATWREESHLQRTFEADWSHGEWFSLSPRSSQLIADIQRDGRLPAWAIGTDETRKWFRPSSKPRGSQADRYKLNKLVARVSRETDRMLSGARP
jgi:T5orf172 domain